MWQRTQRLGARVCCAGLVSRFEGLMCYSSAGSLLRMVYTPCLEDDLTKCLQRLGSDQGHQTDREFIQ